MHSYKNTSFKDLIVKYSLADLIQRVNDVALLRDELQFIYNEKVL